MSVFVIPDDVYGIVKTNPKRASAFAGAFEVTEDVFKGAYDARVAQDAADVAAAMAAEAIKANREALGVFTRSRCGGYDVPASVTTLANEAIKLADSLSKDDMKVSFKGFDFGVNTDGKSVLTPRFGGLTVKSESKGGTRKKYTYFCDTTEIEGRLKPFILKHYPESDAAAEIRDYDPKMGGSKKGSKSAFDCCQDDDEMKNIISRLEKLLPE